MFSSRDCASLVMDVYRTMGIKLPRNSGEQGKFAVGNFYEMPENMSIADREKLLDALTPGTALYMSGHAMIYLGTEKNDIILFMIFQAFIRCSRMEVLNIINHVK